MPARFAVEPSPSDCFAAMVLVDDRPMPGAIIEVGKQIRPNSKNWINSLVRLKALVRSALLSNPDRT